MRGPSEAAQRGGTKIKWHKDKVAQRQRSGTKAEVAQKQRSGTKTKKWQKNKEVALMPKDVVAWGGRGGGRGYTDWLAVYPSQPARHMYSLYTYIGPFKAVWGPRGLQDSFLGPGLRTLDFRVLDFRV